MKKIGQLTTKVGSGVTPKGGENVYTTEGHPFVRSQNVGNGHMLLKDIAFIDENTHKKQIATEIQKGDVLLNITGASIGRSSVAFDEVVGGNVNQHVCIVRPNKEILPYYLCYLFLSDKGQKQIDSFQAGGNRQGLNFEQIKSFKFSIPTIAEQEKVSDLLFLMDERIETQSRAIEDLKQLRLALYQRVFTNLQGDSVSLKSVADVIKGNQINGDKLSENGKYYVMNGGVLPSGYYDEFNTPANTISISEGGNSCGYVQFNEEPFWSGGHCYTLQVCKTINVRYLFHYLKYKEQDIMKLRIGSGLPNIQKKDLEHFMVVIPNTNKQQKLTSLFDCIQIKENIEKALLSQWQIQKRYLLQKMFI